MQGGGLKGCLQSERGGVGTAPTGRRCNPVGRVESQSGSGDSMWSGGKLLGRRLSLLGQAQLWNHPLSDPLQGREDWRRTGGDGECWWIWWIWRWMHSGFWSDFGQFFGFFPIDLILFHWPSALLAQVLIDHTMGLRQF